MHLVSFFILNVLYLGGLTIIVYFPFEDFFVFVSNWYLYKTLEIEPVF